MSATYQWIATSISLHTLDRKIIGPKGFSGDIGRMLDRCEKFDVVNFNLILLDMSQSGLSTDQKHLYNIHKSISERTVSEGLANKNPGKLAHSQ